MTGEELGYLMEKLLAAGALDVWFTPIQMKKNRPATQVHALCAPTDTRRIAGALLRQSTTLGVRISHASRMTLERRVETVATPYGDVRVKRAEGRVKPEFDDMRAAAEAHDVPLRAVWRATWAACREDGGA